jgi:hypothetical protein
MAQPRHNDIDASVSAAPMPEICTGGEQICPLPNSFRDLHLGKVIRLPGGPA